MNEDVEFIPMLCLGLFVGISWLVTIGLGWIIVRREKSTDEEEHGDG